MSKELEFTPWQVVEKDQLTVGDFRRMLEEFPDDLDIGFINQPRQYLHSRLDHGRIWIGFQPLADDCEYAYMLLDETSEDDNYLVGVFESLEKAREFLATIKKPIDDDKEFQELVLRQIELNKGEFAIDSDPVLKLEIQEVLIIGTEDDWGWEVTKWRWKKQKHVPGKWEPLEQEVKND